jgi:hypothetical protein
MPVTVAPMERNAWLYCPPAVRTVVVSSGRAGDAAGCDWRPPRISEQTMASAQISTEVRKAWTMPLVKSAEMLGARCPTVPRKTAFVVARLGLLR